ncbi:hypothetical protein [Methylobacterium soli]|uniref:Uncharacterized protein n=1 Tax=Methylobacterium soli TaxID=553447 RepID=A0A6L3SSI2_9HYPH|nr:hypothetical protein [Methylobacterium soli]KAB1075390.1 hypothetical protein F6X53_24790 [Methylobacterium soli]
MSRLIDAEVAMRGTDALSRKPKTDLAAGLAGPDGADVERVARWMRDPTRGLRPWRKKPS